ncbi:MAG: alcohol dehydrogenase catalytic domain-containing protein [Myxococcales bacterium]
MHALSLAPDLAVREIDVPRRRPGEALIRVSLAGVCNTDLELVKGYMGFSGVLGHEFVGHVVEADSPAWVGKRVNGEINLGCGHCDVCAHGLARHCPQRTVLGILGKDGCFAEYVTLPERNLFEVPRELSDEAAVFTEPLAAAHEILEQVRVASGQRCLVLGDGKLGLLCALVLSGVGAQVHLVGKHGAKLELARRRGVTVYQLPDRPAGSFDLVVEATGSAQGLKSAVEATRPRGTLVLKSTFHGAVSLETAPIVIHELTLVGSRCGPFAPALEAMRAQRIDPTPLISQRFALPDATRAFEAASTKGCLKVLLDPLL